MVSSVLSNLLCIIILSDKHKTPVLYALILSKLSSLFASSFVSTMIIGIILFSSSNIIFSSDITSSFPPL